MAASLREVISDAIFFFCPLREPSKNISPGGCFRNVTLF